MTFFLGLLRIFAPQPTVLLDTWGCITVCGWHLYYNPFHILNILEYLQFSDGVHLGYFHRLWKPIRPDLRGTRLSFSDRTREGPEENQSIMLVDMGWIISTISWWFISTRVSTIPNFTTLTWVVKKINSSTHMVYELTWLCLATNISGRTYEYTANMNIDMNINIDIRRITEYTNILIYIYSIYPLVI